MVYSRGRVEMSGGTQHHYHCCLASTPPVVWACIGSRPCSKHIPASLAHTSSLLKEQAKRLSQMDSKEKYTKQGQVDVCKGDGSRSIGQKKKHWWQNKGPEGNGRKVLACASTRASMCVDDVWKCLLSLTHTISCQNSCETQQLQKLEDSWSSREDLLPISNLLFP